MGGRLPQFGCRTKLLHQAHSVLLQPLIHDLPIGDAEHQDTCPRNLFTRRWYLHEFAFVRAVRLLTGRDFVPFGDERLIGDLDVGESLVQHPNGLSDALTIRR